MNKKGFTLIELLAVIIILGILMIIAIPSVTKYINDSRKSSYIDTAKELVGAARNLVNDGKLEMYDTDTTYYIDIACLKTENGGKAVSPYGDFVKEKAYVVVTFDGKGYEYFWTSIDDSGQGIKDLVRYDKLDIDRIESDLKIDDITINRGLDGRNKVILITERNNCQKEGANNAEIQIDGETGEENNPVIYPNGKDKTTVVVGDIVKIGTEEFYVVKHDGNNLVLLARYNLNVGNFKKTSALEGMQDRDVKGWIENGSVYGIVPFSNYDYWNSNVSSYPADISLDNSLIKTYIDNYASKLEVHVKEARLLKYNEIIELGCLNSNYSCISAYPFVTETSYWIGVAYASFRIVGIGSDKQYNNSNANISDTFGVRPVIVI